MGEGDLVPRARGKSGSLSEAVCVLLLPVCWVGRGSSWVYGRAPAVLRGSHAEAGRGEGPGKELHQAVGMLVGRAQKQGGAPFPEYSTQAALGLPALLLWGWGWGQGHDWVGNASAVGEGEGRLLHGRPCSPNAVPTPSLPPRVPLLSSVTVRPPPLGATSSSGPSYYAPFSRGHLIPPSPPLPWG